MTHDGVLGIAKKKGEVWEVECLTYGETWLMNVPQLASRVRGALGMYSAPIQIFPDESATAAE